MQNCRNSKIDTGSGFTLIELMIVVAIIAILAAVALPAYRDYIVKTKRSAAESYMHSLASKQEQYMLNARVYADSMATLGETAPAEVAGSYTVTVGANNAATPPTYLITANPINTQATYDTKCKDLTLDQAGTKTKSGTASTVTECWK